MERGLTRVAGVLAILILLLFSVQLTITPTDRAQLGQWTITTSLQAGLSMGVATVTISGSGVSTLNVNGQGQISGTGSFSGSITVTASTGCSGGGTFPFSESETYSGQMTNSATHNATIQVTTSASTAPTSFTVTCPNPSPPPATETYNFPIPSQMGTAAGTYSILLVNGYTYAQNFPSPMTGGVTMRVNGGTTTVTTTTTTASSTLTAPSSTTTGTTSTSSTSSGVIDTKLSIMGLGGNLNLVQVCEPGMNNCRQPYVGEVLQPGECIVTSSAATPTGISGGLASITTGDGKMLITMGQDGEFCAPLNTGGVVSLYQAAYAFYQSFGSFGVSDEYPAGANVHVLTPFVDVSPLGTRFAIQTSSKGTTVVVIAGSVQVTELTAKSSVQIHAGQMITITNSTVGMTQQEMQQSTTAFDMAAMDQWWSPFVALTSATSISTASNSSESTSNASPFLLPTFDLTEIAIVAAVVAILAVLALTLRRRRPGKPEEAIRAIVQPQPPATRPN